MRADSRDPVDAVTCLKEHLIFSNRKVTVNECDAEAISGLVLDKNLAQGFHHLSVAFVQKPGPAVRVLLRLAFLLMLAIWLCAVYVAFYGMPDKFFNIVCPILPTVSDPCSASALLNFRTSGFQQAMRSKCFDSHE